MNVPDRNTRSLCLFSGGLDSQLAVRLLAEQGLSLQGLVFSSPFFDIAPAQAAAERLGLSLRVVDFSTDLLAVLRGPSAENRGGGEHGVRYHTRMLTVAGEFMTEEGLDFISTGDVLGQRAYARSAGLLARIDRAAGCAGTVVRPLSARLLRESVPEQRQWVDRERLMGIEGRGRTEQLQMAERLGITAFPSVSTACRFTDEGFERRIADACEHQELRDVSSLRLLILGRHFRLADASKLVVGRNQGENVRIEGLAGPHDLVLKIDDTAGPTGILPVTATEREQEQAARICARYADAGSGTTKVRLRSTCVSRVFEVGPLDPAAVDALRAGAQGAAASE